MKLYTRAEVERIVRDVSQRAEIEVIGSPPESLLCEGIVDVIEVLLRRELDHEENVEAIARRMERGS